MSIYQEFQAVVLAAGRGSRMPEITSNKPKCLLPVGTRPLIWYPLYKLQETGFSDAIVILLESQKEEVQASVNKLDLEIKIEYFCVGNEDIGTADSLRLIHDRIKHDVLVISCDFISDIKLKDALNVFRQHNASITTLLLNPEQTEPIVVPGPKSKYKPERDLIGIDAQTNRLIFLASASDFEAELSLPKSLLKKHTNITMYSNLIDSHVYIIRKWVVKYLQKESSISTVKGELIPHIIKKQLAKPPKVIETNTSVLNTKEPEDIFSYATESNLDLLIRNASAFNDHVGDLKECYCGDYIRCYAFIAGPETFGVRVNTTPSYWYANSKILEKWTKITDGKELILKSPKADIKSNQIDDKCVVWDLCSLHEKTSFKNCVIAHNSEVHSFSRVFNSIVMNNVTIMEKVAIENSIICSGAVIEKGSHLNGCIVGSHHRIPENSKHTNEVLTKSDQLMEF